MTGLLHLDWEQIAGNEEEDACDEADYVAMVSESGKGPCRENEIANDEERHGSGVVADSIGVEVPAEEESVGEDKNGEGVEEARGGKESVDAEDEGLEVEGDETEFLLPNVKREEKEEFQHASCSGVARMRAASGSGDGKNCVSFQMRKFLHK